MSFNRLVEVHLSSKRKKIPKILLITSSGFLPGLDPVDPRDVDNVDELREGDETCITGRPVTRSSTERVAWILYSSDWQAKIGCGAVG